MLSRGPKPLPKTYANTNPNSNSNANTKQEYAEGRRRFALLLILILTCALAAGRQDANPRGQHIAAAPNWQELMAAMKTMDAAMASVQPSADSDLNFVRLMFPHHQAAIEMAKTQLLYGPDPQLQIAAEGLTPKSQYQIYPADSDRPPYSNLQPLAVLKTNPDGAGISQSIGPLKVLAPSSAASLRRFLIVAEANDASNVVRRQASATTTP
jgi:hypothetical protein